MKANLAVFWFLSTLASSSGCSIHEHTITESSVGGSNSGGGSSSSGSSSGGSSGGSSSGGSSSSSGGSSSSSSSGGSSGGSGGSSSSSSGGSSSSSIGGTSAVGGAATGGAAQTGGANSTGGAATGGVTSTSTSVVAIAAGPWSSASTNETTATIPITALDSAVYMLVAAVANIRDSTDFRQVTNVTYGSLTFTRLVGGNVPGTGSCAEFWGARSTTAQLAKNLVVTTNAASDIGVHVWALSGVNASNAVGTVIEQAQRTSTQYIETFPNKRSGSLLFGAFFNTGYDQDKAGITGYLTISALTGSVSGQTYAGYYVWSEASSGSGAQTIGANLPGSWTMEHAAIEIVP